MGSMRYFKMLKLGNLISNSAGRFLEWTHMMQLAVFSHLPTNPVPNSTKSQL
jgi:hypothetical protein